MLNIYYINLDNATKRREAVEENLGKFKSNDVGIYRISAVDKEYVEKNDIHGGTRSNEKACFLCHVMEADCEKLNSLQAIPNEFYGKDDLVFVKTVSTVMSENFPHRLF